MDSFFAWANGPGAFERGLTIVPKDSISRGPPRPRKPLERVIVEAGFALPADPATRPAMPSSNSDNMTPAIPSSLSDNTTPAPPSLRFDKTSFEYRDRCEKLLTGMENRLRTLIARHTCLLHRQDLLSNHRSEVERRLNFLAPKFSHVEPPMLADPAAVADPSAVRALRHEWNDFGIAIKRLRWVIDELEGYIWKQARRVQVAEEDMKRLDVERGYAIMHELWVEGGIDEFGLAWVAEDDLHSLLWSSGGSSCTSSSAGAGGAGGGGGDGSSCVTERDAGSVRDDGGFSSDEDAAILTPGSGARSPVLPPSYLSFPDTSGLEARRRH